VPDITDGQHTVRIRYDPNFDERAVLHPSFQTNGFTTWFLEVIVKRVASLLLLTLLPFVSG
jgi:hypothetical protein